MCVFVGNFGVKLVNMWENVWNVGNVDHDKKIRFHHMWVNVRRFIMYEQDMYRNEFTPFVRRLESTDIDQEFTEFVRLSKNWKDLARRCGVELQFGSGGNKWRSTLQKKVMSLGLDTEHSQRGR
jgi:hypothetical protein